MENNKKIIEKLTNEARAVKKEFHQRMFSYLAAAFGLVVALAWNDAVKSFLDYFFPASESGIAAKFIYASFLTLIVATFLYYLEKIFSDKKDAK